MSWYDAARFTNWMHNGQGRGSTETGAYTVTGNAGLIPKNVGAYGVNSDSAYGTNDQAGNVFEWNDAVIGSSRGLRGGSWNNNSNNLPASNRNNNKPTNENNNVGFRVARPPARPEETRGVSQV